MKHVAVVKIGSNSLVDRDGNLDQTRFDAVADQVAAVQSTHDSVVVTSGAISAGASEIGVDRSAYAQNYRFLQCLAAIGQPILMEYWRTAFRRVGKFTGQFLVTPNELAMRDDNRQMFVGSIAPMARGGHVPIVNENDPMADDEIRSGDNDKLSSLVAVSLAKAALWKSVSLVLLSDVDCVYRDYGTAKQARIGEVTDIEAIRGYVVSGGSVHGTGGMETKLDAARVCMASGVDMYIANARTDRIIEKVLGGDDVGTHFYPNTCEAPS